MTRDIDRRSFLKWSAMTAAIGSIFRVKTADAEPELIAEYKGPYLKPCVIPQLFWRANERPFGSYQSEKHRYTPPPEKKERYIFTWRDRKGVAYWKLINNEEARKRIYQHGLRWCDFYGSWEKVLPCEQPLPIACCMNYCDKERKPEIENV